MKDKKVLLLVSVMALALIGIFVIYSIINHSEDNINSEAAIDNEDDYHDQEAEKLEIAQIRNICELSTLECEFTNIAKSVKEPGTGLNHWGEQERKFWIEYRVKVRISYDISRIEMNQNSDEIAIYLPEPTVTSSIIADSWNEDSYIIEKDQVIQKNPITADDQTKAVNDSCETIEDEVRNNSSLIASADQQARTLIENYINQIGKLNNIEYKITWKEHTNSYSMEPDKVEDINE